MTDNDRTVCPIPNLGDCVQKRCNCWDEEQEECSGACCGEYDTLEETGPPDLGSPCTIYWTEDHD